MYRRFVIKGWLLSDGHYISKARHVRGIILASVKGSIGYVAPATNPVIFRNGCEPLRGGFEVGGFSGERGEREANVICVPQCAAIDLTCLTHSLAQVPIPPFPPAFPTIQTFHTLYFFLLFL